LTARKIPRPLPAPKRFHSTADDFKLPDFEVRPQETLIAHFDLKDLLDGIDNSGGED